MMIMMSQVLIDNKQFTGEFIDNRGSNMLVHLRRKGKLVVLLRSEQRYTLIWAVTVLLSSMFG